LNEDKSFPFLDSKKELNECDLSEIYGSIRLGNLMMTRASKLTFLNEKSNDPKNENRNIILPQTSKIGRTLENLSYNSLKKSTINQLQSKRPSHQK
jgi:hypothetical protein